MKIGIAVGLGAMQALLVGAAFHAFGWNSHALAISRLALVVRWAGSSTTVVERVVISTWRPGAANQTKA
jgi:hypothetical protein